MINTKIDKISDTYAKVLLCLGLMAGQSLVAENNRTNGDAPFVAFGDLRGNLEPCGCDPRTDLGGVRRLANYLSKQRSLIPNLAILNLGNNEKLSQTEKFENSILLKMLANIQPTATLYNEVELKIETVADESILRRQNYVISNSHPDSRLKRPYVETVLTDESIVFGYVSPSTTLTSLEAFTPSLGKRWKKKIKKSRKKAVLLFSGNDSSLAEIAEEKIFDVIIRSNTQAFNSSFDHKEKENPEVLSKVMGEMTIFEVPLGGLGVVLGGGAEAIKAPSLETIFKSTTCLKDPTHIGNVTCDSQGLPSIITGTQDRLFWLTSDYETKEQLKEEFRLLDTYRKDRFDLVTKQRKSHLKDSQFVGADACKGCHQSEYQSWSKSAHAAAYPTLITQHQDKNMECVTCHVVGYEKKGGFASLEFSPHLANVQCENCHGPRLDHISNPSAKNVPESKTSAAVCEECHKGAHSPNFDFEKYWEKIKHGKK